MSSTRLVLSSTEIIYACLLTATLTLTLLGGAESSHQGGAERPGRLGRPAVHRHGMLP
jgi:hypothetical protein